MVKFSSLSIDLVQNQNETTPEGSEMNYGATPAPAPPACASPPIKKKKVSGLKKKRKLEPKSLSFQEETGLYFYIHEQGFYWPILRQNIDLFPMQK